MSSTVHNCAVTLTLVYQSLRAFPFVLVCWLTAVMKRMFCCVRLVSVSSNMVVDVEDKEQANAAPGALLGRNLY